MDNFLNNVTIFDHPLIKHKVTHLCDVHTGSKEFSEIVKEISMLMGYEALKDLKMKEVEITAPLKTSPLRCWQRNLQLFPFFAPAWA